MLNSFLKGACVLAAVASFSASAAQAEDHVIMIVDGDYFPSVVHVAEGDSLTFKNESKVSHVVNGEADAWTSGPIGISGTYTHEVTASTPASFYASSSEATGEIVFQ